MFWAPFTTLGSLSSGLEVGSHPPSPLPPALRWVGKPRSPLRCCADVHVGGWRLSSGLLWVCVVLFGSAGGELLVFLLARSGVSGEKSFDRGIWAHNLEAPGSPNWVREALLTKGEATSCPGVSNHSGGPFGGIRTSGKKRKGTGLRLLSCQLLIMQFCTGSLTPVFWDKVQLIRFFVLLTMGQRPSFQSPCTLGCLPGLLVSVLI